jgi:hypothetical protein
MFCGEKLLSRFHFSQLHSHSAGLSIGASGGSRSRTSLSAKGEASDAIGSAGQRVVVQPQSGPGGRQPHRRRDRDFLAKAGFALPKAPMYLKVQCFTG